MKLAELKSSLEEQFFDGATSGVHVDDLPAVYETLSEVKCVPAADGSHSSEPSKAFALFTKERNTTLAIIEEDGMQKRALFSAVKSGTQVFFSVLTKEDRQWQKGDFKTVKDALRQAKNLNDEVDFHVINL